MKIEFTSKRLKHYRKLRQLSIQELSQGSGVSQALIEKIEESAVRSAHPMILERLANALLLDLQDLLEESDPPEPPVGLPRSVGWVADRIADVLTVVLFSLAVFSIVAGLHLGFTIFDKLTT